MHSLECLNLFYLEDCIMTFIRSAGVVKKATTNPATAPFSNPSTKDRLVLPLDSLYISQAPKSTELVKGKVNRGQQMPVNSSAAPQCLMMYLMVSLMFLSSGLSCMRTLTVSKKNPDTQLTTPDTIPLVKSIKEFICLSSQPKSNKTTILKFTNTDNNGQN